MFTKDDRDGQGTYVIGYWDTGTGVLFYDYIYIPSGEEAATGIAIAIIIISGLAGIAAGAGAAAGVVVGFCA